MTVDDDECVVCGDRDILGDRHTRCRRCGSEVCYSCTDAAGICSDCCDDDDPEDPVDDMEDPQ